MRRNFSTKFMITLCSVICFVCMGFGIALQPQGIISASAEELKVSVENLEIPADNTIIFYLSETDFITAEFDENDNTAARYKWVDTLAYEDRFEYNVHNALLDKNASEFNYTEYITIDGEPIKNMVHQLSANKFQRIEGLGLSFFGDDTYILSTATEIFIKAGCTIPTLARGYFGVEEPSAIVIEEDTMYRKREGAWVKSYAFDGYEEGTVYDANERLFYKRLNTNSFHGYTEAPTCEFTTGYAAVGDMDFVLTSTIDTKAGNLFILDFVNPIDTTVFGGINLRFYVHEPRTMVTYNANGVSSESLGPVLENVTTAAGWTYVPLMLPLYADENGMVDRLVFQFTNEGDLVNTYRNQVAIGEFYLTCEQVNTLLYDGSLMIADNEADYGLTFRFNKKGDFTSETLDYSKVAINGKTLAEINEEGDFVTAKWISLQGIYQINITLSKQYQGEAQIKNADVGYACNAISVMNGLSFPNGEILDRTYHYHLYRNFTDNLIFEDEVVIDYETNQTFEETKPTGLSWNFNQAANGNIEMLLSFDKKITNRMINHVCEPEVWRETILGGNGLYEASYTEVFIAGGYKSSLFDSVILNGMSVGEFHARNNHQTCVFVHYGQSGFNTVGINIESHAPAYAELKTLFESGEGVTIEIKSGFKFPTGVKTETNYVFKLQNGTFVLENNEETYPVYFDGTLVKNGDSLKVDYQALTSSVFVDGTSFVVEQSKQDNVVTFKVKYNGTEMTFSVEENITQSPDVNTGGGIGCGASLSLGGGMALLSAAIVLTTKKRRKQDE